MDTVNIFPFIEVSDKDLSEATEDLPLAREYAWDFEKNDFKRKNGKMYLVEANEAIKIWLWKLFQTPRFRYLIFSWDYGNELESLIGKGYSKALVDAEARRYVEEAIEYNLGEYVTQINEIEILFDDGALTINLSVETPYGQVKSNNYVWGGGMY